MTTKKANIFVFILVSLSITYWIIFPASTNDKVSNIILNVSLNIFSAMLLYIILQVLIHLNDIWFYFQTQFIYRNREIRISLAYIYRITVNNKYLLVKSNHRNYYQPVGGAYKTLPGSEKIFDMCDVRTDRIIETSKGIAKGDLRVYVKGKCIVDFMNWFNSKEDREISPWREFCEELISKKVLPSWQFRYIDYKFKKTIKTPIFRLDTGDLGFFMYDVFDLVANDEQKTILNELFEKGNNEYLIWADEYIINRLGHDERNRQYQYEIGIHTKWALNLKYSKA